MKEAKENPILSEKDQKFDFDTFSKFESVFKSQTLNKQSIKSSSYSQRKNKLIALKTSIIKNRKLIEDALYFDLGKNVTEAGYSELFPTLSEIRYIIRNLKRWMKPRSVSNSFPYIGSKSKVMMEPKGNCLIVTPWNYPFYLSISHLAVCIAAGNVAILKPSEYSRATSILLKNVLSELFEENEVAVLFCDAEVSAQITTLPFDHIHFTGSTHVGKMVMENGARHLTSVTLELGGKSPVVIDENYAIKDCVKQIGWGKFLNAGQTCIAPDYLLVHKSKRKELVEQLSDYLLETFGKDAIDSEYLSSIINIKHFRRICQLIEDAKSKGNETIYQSNQSEENLKIGPTLILINDPDTAIMEEEIFGPILPIIEYEDIERALDIINAKPKPLSMYLFSNDKKWLNHVLTHTSCGGVSINDTMAHFVQTYLPMGGVNHSGIGKSHGYYGFMEFSNEKAILKSYLKGGITWPFHFPYTNFKKRILEILIKYF